MAGKGAQPGVLLSLGVAGVNVQQGSGTLVDSTTCQNQRKEHSGFLITRYRCGGTGGGWRNEGLKPSAVNIRKGVRYSVSGVLCEELRSQFPVLRSKEAKKLKSNKSIRELRSWGESLTPKLERNIKKQPFQNMPRIYVEKCVTLIYIEGKGSKNS